MIALKKKQKKILLIVLKTTNHFEREGENIKKIKQNGKIFLITKRNIQYVSNESDVSDDVVETKKKYEN